MKYKRKPQGKIPIGKFLVGLGGKNNFTEALYTKLALNLDHL